MDRLYKLDFKNDGVYLTLKKQTPFYGRRMKDDIIKRLLNKRITSLNIGAVRNLLDTEGGAARIAPAQSEYILDEHYSITISEDTATASVVFSPPDGGRLVVAAEIYESLKKLGVVRGILGAVIDSLSENTEKDFFKSITIAHGVFPVKGKDGWIEPHYKYSQPGRPAVLADGSVDHKSLGYIYNVKKGAKLATLHDATDGKEGRGVTDAAIPPRKGKAVTLPAGTNTEISGDGRTLRATSDGRLDVRGGKINVVRSFTVDGDAGPATGHIEFLGDVIVSGGVLEGYNVSASDSITVNGAAGPSNISAGGDIVIKEGVTGKPGCAVTAGGNLTARFIENAEVRAGGEIRTGGSVNSVVSCGGSFSAEGKYGNITSGEVTAGGNIYCVNAGGKTSAATLRAGVAPEIRESREKLFAEVAELTAKLNDHEAQLQSLYRLRNERELSPEQKFTLAGLIANREWAAARLAEKNEKLADANKKFENGGYGRIRVRGTLHAGVRLVIGAAEKTIAEDTPGCVASLQDGEIVIDLS